jgi:hypothetical protein
MKTQGNEMKTAILGAVGKVKAKGGHKPNKEKLQEVLAEGASIGAFCTGCGFHQGFSKQGAMDIAETFEIKPRELTKEKFFTMARCILCDDDFKEVKLEVL